MMSAMMLLPWLVPFLAAPAHKESGMKARVKYYLIFALLPLVAHTLGGCVALAACTIVGVEYATSPVRARAATLVIRTQPLRNVATCIAIPCGQSTADCPSAET